jgi:hypothetical protein
MKKKDFYIWTLLIIITRIIDSYTTFLSSPDLKYELNPIIKMFPNWSFTILLGIVFTSFVVLCFYFSYKNQELFCIKAISIKQYISYYFFNKEIKNYEFFYKLPLLKPFVVFIGLVFPISLFYYSLVVILNNTFIYLTYKSITLDKLFVKIHKIQVPSLVVIAILITIVISFYIIKKYYKLYNQKDSNAINRYS